MTSSSHSGSSLLPCTVEKLVRVRPGVSDFVRERRRGQQSTTMVWVFAGINEEPSNCKY